MVSSHCREDQLRQQEALASAWAEQVCWTFVTAVLPTPRVTTLFLQPPQRWFSTVVVCWMCPFSVVTICAASVLHWLQAWAGATAGDCAIAVLRVAPVRSCAPLTWSAALR